MPDDIEQRINALRETIRRHDRLYYLDDKPEISDREYDALYRQLRDLEQAHPELVTADSPTQRMHGGVSTGFATVPHTIPMLSLENTYNADDLARFHDGVVRGLHGQHPEYVVEPKIDGISIAVRYVNGVFAQAVTRGNGRQGDDVTDNIRTIPSIPLRLHTGNPPAFFEARGECYMSREGFQLLNDRRIAEGQEPFANARNATAGSVKLLDSSQVACRPLDVFFYAQGRLDGIDIASQEELFEVFVRFGLRVQKWRRVVTDFAGIKQAIDELEGARRSFPYDTDGAVVKVNRFDQRAILGFSAKAPCWAKAYKYEPERAQTRLNGITIQVGRTGVLTPVAELEPVFLAGSTISRATLHNEDEIVRRDIRIGDTVKIEKAGEVIPAVVEVVLSKRPADAVRFDFCGSLHGRCPSCGGPISRDPNFAVWRCANLQCPAQNVRRVEYFAARSALDIESLGGAVAEALCDRGLIAEPLDLYGLAPEQLAGLNLGSDDEPRLFGAKNAAKLLNALDAARRKPLGAWLQAMGIPEVGSATAYCLGRIHATLDQVADSPYLKLLLDLLDCQNGISPSRTIAVEAPPEKSQTPAADLFAFAEQQQRQLQAQSASAHFDFDNAAKRLLHCGLIRKSSAKGAYVTTVIGPKTAIAVLEFFHGAVGRRWLERMARLGIAPQGGGEGGTTASEEAATPLAGQTFVLTGTLSSMDRESASARIRARGGNVASAVSRNTTWLVAGANTGATKTGKAAQLGVKVIGEEEFLKILGE